MSELVAKTAAAVAITDTLTTLIDWTNIEALSGFTIIIANAGGGSHDNLTDVQIDTSADGGVTPVLDQHAGVPAVPIASGAAAQATFTETAKYVRVRAICATDKDTTATAILLADSVTGRICTLADVKDRIGLTVTDYDGVINRILSGIEYIFNESTQRTLILNSVDVTEYYTGGGPYLQLTRYPVKSITSIKEAVDYDFDNAVALVADTDYRLVAAGKKGLIYRPYTSWLELPDVTQVIYKGGFVAAGQTAGSGETAMPADLREAAIEQAAYFYKHKDDIGLSSASFKGESFNKFADINLLPMVEAILKNYKRVL
jgi:hypothetical protein